MIKGRIFSLLIDVWRLASNRFSSKGISFEACIVFIGVCELSSAETMKDVKNIK
jgi:hypothetical protein